MTVSRLRFLFGISMIILCLWSLPDSALYAGDIVLAGNDVMVIENTTYTQTGNIYVKDNAKLTFRNATLIMNMSYHEEFQIYISGKGTLEIIGSTMKHIIPGENIECTLIDETALRVEDSDLSIGRVYFLLGSPRDLREPFKGTATILRTKFEDLDISFSPNGGMKVSIEDSTCNQFALRFLQNYNGKFSNLKPGLFTEWVYQQEGYDISIKNTSFFNFIIAGDGPSDVVIRDSEIFQFAPTFPSPLVKMRAVNSKIVELPLHGMSGITASFWGLKPGHFDLFKLSEHSSGGPLPEIVLENTDVIGRWAINSFGSTITIDDSVLSVGLYYGGNPPYNNNLYVTNSSVYQLFIYGANQSVINFDNTSVQWFNVYVPPNTATIIGNVTFQNAVLMPWYGPSTIKRNFLVTIVGNLGSNPPAASLSLYDKAGTLVWSSQTDAQGKANFDIEFNDTNHTDTWNLRIQFNGKTTTESITLLTSTPIKVARTYTITASSGPNGIVSPTGAIEAKEGDDQTFAITPDRFSLDRVTAGGILTDGAYRVADVLVDGVFVGRVNTYTFINVKGNHTISAVFEADLVKGRGIVYDDFGGTGIDTSKWIVNDTNNVLSLSGGYLNVDAAGNANYYHLTSKQTFPGDFDIVLPYKDFQTTATSAGGRAPEINISSTSVSGNWAEIRVGGFSSNMSIGTNCSLNGTASGNSVSTTYFSGWLRMVRTGSILRTYYREDERWNRLGNFTNYTGNVTVGIKVYSGDSGTFHVSSDGVYSLSPTLSDAISILQLLSGASSTRLDEMMDFNGDKKIGLAEVIFILQKVSGMR